MESMRELWKAVLAQAVNDAIQEDPYSPENRRAKEEAINWFTRRGNDFDRVCMFAHLDSDAVHEAFMAGRFCRVTEKKSRDFRIVPGVSDETPNHA